MAQSPGPVKPSGRGSPHAKPHSVLAAPVLRCASSKWAKTKRARLRTFQWQNGYGALSVSHSNVGRVRKYMDGQDEHHKTMSFQDEVRALLRKHGVAFDERYMWD
jgi:putative transposase